LRAWSTGGSAARPSAKYQYRDIRVREHLLSFAPEKETTQSATGNRIYTFDPDGNFSGAAYAPAPMGLVVSSTGPAYVPFQCDHQIYRVGLIPPVAGGYPELSYPIGMAEGPDGCFYVTEKGAIPASDCGIYPGVPDRHKVMKLSPSLDPIVEWGRFGSSDGEFSNPWDVVVDQYGNVFVLDRGNSRVQKFGEAPISTKVTSWS